jgi:hypothetical protein
LESGDIRQIRQPSFQEECAQPSRVAQLVNKLRVHKGTPLDPEQDESSSHLHAEGITLGFVSVMSTRLSFDFPGGPFPSVF